jgi:hypothetical protein
LKVLPERLISAADISLSSLNLLQAGGVFLQNASPSSSSEVVLKFVTFDIRIWTMADTGWTNTSVRQ